MRVRIGTVVIEECTLQLADGSARTVGPNSGLTLSNEAGEESGLDNMVVSALVRDPDSWSGKDTDLDLGEPACLLSDGGRVRVNSIYVRARHDVEDAEQTLLRHPGDWVFERVGPAGMETELHFFQFAELDELADADTLFREVCLTTSCPVHGQAARAVQVVWSQNERTQKTAQFKIEPCCEDQDAAVFAALKLAAAKLQEKTNRNLLDFARAVVTHSRANSEGGKQE